MKPAWVIQPGGEGIDLQAGSSDRKLSRRPPACRGIFSVMIRPCGFAVGMVGALPQAGS